eukprot:GDKK01012190.1.p1 GENE.GDKK01012190.1~~GDKK01012190.1.p1  ORF type:complete len:181 (-),score=28.97 GDKK01012190.1:82-624(-)
MSAIILFFSSGAMAAKKGDVKPSEDFEKNIENHMPDPSDPENQKQLKCSACAAVVQEMYGKFTEITKEAHEKGYKQAKDYEFVDAMDEICSTINKEWGLQVEGDSVSLNYRPKSVAKYQVRTGWVGSLIRDRCAEITDKYDQQLIKLGKGTKDRKDWAELICVVLDKTCAQVLDKDPEDL